MSLTVQRDYVSRKHMRLVRRTGLVAFYLVGEADEPAAFEKLQAANPGCRIDAHLRESGLVILRVEKEGAPASSENPLAIVRVEIRSNRADR